MGDGDLHTDSVNLLLCKNNSLKAKVTSELGY